LLYNPFKGNDISVSEIGFGLWTLSTPGWTQAKYTNSVNLLREAFDLGINLYDVADSYGKGYGEDLIHESLGTVRKEIILSTKAGFDFYSPDLEGLEIRKKNFDPDYISFACEQSLRRLHTDYIDIFQLHYPEITDVEMDGAFEAMQRLKEDGKILCWGAALDDTSRSGEIAEILIDDKSAEVIHLPYNLIEREPLKSLEDRLSRCEAIVLARRPHCYGMLDSSFETDSIEPNLFEKEAISVPDKVSRAIELARKVIQLCREFDVEPRKAATQFVLENSAVVSVLPNIKDSHSLREFVEDLGSLNRRSELPNELVLSLDEFQFP
jgi:aryl-alcohol dehydrogenase-like predicted oxidoreductase